MAKIDTHIPNRFVEENPFLTAEPEDRPLPTLDDVRNELPQPAWAGHQATIDCYWKVWELAFRHLRQPAPGSGFVANFIDTAFNDCIFMWDSAFILMFGRYGRRGFDFQRTLDNLYSHQHPDGFICREIQEVDGEEHFERHDPPSTGPNILPWAEWEHYLGLDDRDRLARVFPPLVAYYQWLRHYRTWPDGTYWTCGWGSGMDNQPRLQEGYHVWWSHGHMTWTDATLQQTLSARQLLQMAHVLGRQDEVPDLERDVDYLTYVANKDLWDEGSGFYFDRWRDGRLNGVKSIGAYWAIPAGVVPEERLERFIDHLRNPNEFNRPHRVPSLSADHHDYWPEGHYWLGSVWAPTNYMILRGLTQVGEDTLAHEIAHNHLENVVSVFEQTGTLWENYAPEAVSQGDMAKDDFVGWTGLPPVTILFEYVFGLRPDVPNGQLLWDVRLQEAHGIERYPFGREGLLDLHCDARDSQTEEPHVSITSNVPLELTVRWGGGSKTLMIEAGEP